MSHSQAVALLKNATGTIQLQVSYKRLLSPPVFLPDKSADKLQLVSYSSLYLCSKCSAVHRRDKGWRSQALKHHKAPSSSTTIMLSVFIWAVNQRQYYYNRAVFCVCVLTHLQVVAGGDTTVTGPPQEQVGGALTPSCIFQDDLRYDVLRRRGAQRRRTTGCCFGFPLNAFYLFPQPSSV